MSSSLNLGATGRAVVRRLPRAVDADVVFAAAALAALLADPLLLEE